MRTLFWIILAFACVTIGVYPLSYFIAGAEFGLLQKKSELLLNNSWWRLGFYSHIAGGGVALLVGWPQFVEPMRTRQLNLHRNLGKLYLLMVCVSGFTAIAIAPFSSTGWVAGLGFGCLGVTWIYFTWQAYRSIRNRDVLRHECYMIYSYSSCLAAVALRVWLPLLTGFFRLDFGSAYPIVAWLCWVPNLLVARWIVSNRIARSNIKSTGREFVLFAASNSRKSS